MNERARMYTLPNLQWQHCNMHAHSFFEVVHGCWSSPQGCPRCAPRGHAVDFTVHRTVIQLLRFSLRSETVSVSLGWSTIAMLAVLVCLIALTTKATGTSKVQAYLTTTDQSNLFTLQQPLDIHPLAPPPRPLPTVRINTSVTLQRW